MVDDLFEAFAAQAAQAEQDVLAAGTRVIFTWRNGGVTLRDIGDETAEAGTVLEQFVQGAEIVVSVPYQVTRQELTHTLDHATVWCAHPDPDDQAHHLVTALAARGCIPTRGYEDARREETRIRAESARMEAAHAEAMAVVMEYADERDLFVDVFMAQEFAHRMLWRPEIGTAWLPVMAVAALMRDHGVAPVTIGTLINTVDPRQLRPRAAERVREMLDHGMPMELALAAVGVNADALVLLP